jgi:hypothetical protein
LFYRVYLSRNLVIVIAGAVFVLSWQWKPLATLLTVTAALPLFVAEWRNAAGLSSGRARSSSARGRAALAACSHDRDLGANLRDSPGPGRHRPLATHGFGR